MTDDGEPLSGESWSEDEEGDDLEETVIIRCGTTAGPFSMRLTRSWSPNGYDRAVQLFDRGFYDNSHFFRVVPDFLVQFGISYTNSQDLRDTAKGTIPDDPQMDPPIAFEEGFISFAGGGQDSRTSQLFISYGKSKSLGTQLWETPIGEVIEGMENVRNFYSGYGDMPPWGDGPVQNRIEREGRKYIEEEYPLLDRFLRCNVHDENEVTNGGSVGQRKKLAVASYGLASKDRNLDSGGGDSDAHMVRLRTNVADLKKSAYRDHHQNVQLSQEADWVTLMAVGFIVILAVISIFFFNGSNKKKGPKKS